MQDQIAILNEMANLVFNEVSEPFETIHFKGELDTTEECFDGSLAYYFQGTRHSIGMSFTSVVRISDLSFDLHKIMSDHTGGEWKWFTLELDKNGQAKTHFEY